MFRGIRERNLLQKRVKKEKINKFCKDVRRVIMLMAMLFACRVVDGRTEDFDLVPAKLRERVAEIIINDFNLPELVPVKYGGAAV